MTRDQTPLWAQSGGSEMPKRCAEQYQRSQEF